MDKLNGMRRRWIRSIVFFMSGTLLVLYVIIIIFFAKILSDDYTEKCMNYSKQISDNIVMKTKFIESMTDSMAKYYSLNELYLTPKYNFGIGDTLSEMKNFSAYISDIYLTDANSNTYATSTRFANSLQDIPMTKEQWIMSGEEYEMYPVKVLYIKPLYHNANQSGCMVFDISFDGFVHSIIADLAKEYNICFYDKSGNIYPINDSHNLFLPEKTILRKNGRLYIRRNIDTLNMQMVIDADISSAYDKLSSLISSLLAFYLFFMTFFLIITTRSADLIIKPLNRLYNRMNNYIGGG